MSVRSIFVPLDLSPNSKNILRYAVALAQSFQTRLILFHTFLLPDYPPLAGDSMALTQPVTPYFDPTEEEHLREEKLRQLLKDVPELSNVEHELMVVPGIPSDIISLHAKELMTDLIVMGTKGASGLGEIFIGTNGEKVTRTAPCPVLVVPEHFQYRPIRSVCLSVDKGELENERKLEILATTVQNFDAELHILHVREASGSTEPAIFQTLREKLGHLQVFFHTLINENVEESIVKFVETRAIDLSALIHRDHSFFERLMDPGIRKKLVFHTDVPILVLK